VHRSRLYEASARDYRVRYAIRCIMRDRTSDEGAFKVCFEMEDEELIIRIILRRGLGNPKLRSALERSHLIDLTHWLQRFLEFSESYYAEDPLASRNCDAQQSATPAGQLTLPMSQSRP
jgi:hypothetical protein